ncbi:DNA-processing protein DprA [Nonomuraea endophytica]|uniref:DNA-processing protein DprA n=1 Tax=Nonomuraea endophytica TaxID=714136 RepID=UPI0037C9BE9D
MLEEELHGQQVLFAETDLVESAIAEALTSLERWTATGAGVHAFFDADYPSQLRSIHQMPPILFTKGTLAEDTRAIAVVGTRQASEQGLRTASAMARDLALAGVTVVSGLAKGIDAAAHRAALEAGGRTVAVIGTGIDQSYPAENRALQRQISRDGLLLSQFWPDAPPSRRNFPMRNAVMSGYEHQRTAGGTSVACSTVSPGCLRGTSLTG